MTPPKVDEASFERMGEFLADLSQPVAAKMRMVFTLSNLGGPLAVKALQRGFEDSSALLLHEIAYVLGQMKEPSAAPFLTTVLQDVNQLPIVRHEAAEALGAIGLFESLPVLEQYCQDPVREVAETCQIAFDRLKHAQETSKDITHDPTFLSVDPAPAAEGLTVAQLRENLLNTKLSMFDRYRALFALRNLNTAESVDALCAAFDDESSLLRHEIAYVLGQMQNPHAVEALVSVLRRQNEIGMVRHEAAEALGAISTPECDIELRKYLQDPQDVVRESCVVALDIAEYNASDQFQYADGLLKISSEAATTSQ
eukprot:TRINITY_DN1111_c0_g1_i1.p1 TRINITY_DN1111_c0_g1~~TRINITY_DN1111_c0_g1_i1.p1  ORF type:complete len:312 (-),score=72.16 TRINITY_DN1111_c0_g1_i1:429-1364(-)